jgi:undecaprenyl-diphosphatase
MIVAGSIPTAMIGLGLKPFADQLFSSMTLVGVNLLVTGLLLFLTGLIDRRPRNGGAAAVRTEIRLMDALAIGLVQGFAVLPGISRSGSTISTGLLLGVGKPAAAAYSFILSIPAILGAGLMVLRDAVAGAPFEPAACIIGTTASFGMGYAALKLLVFIVNRGQLSYFAPYCWLAGALALVI